MKEIRFIPSSQEVFDLLEQPVVARTQIPQWYKDIEQTHIKKPEFEDNGSLRNTNLKMCIPYWDALVSGYVQTTWTDIYISKSINKEGLEVVEYNYASMPTPMSSRPYKNIKTHDGEYYEIEFTWFKPWIPVLPKGYSILITHPLNRLDLPFTSLNGIVDSDSFYHSTWGNLPFYIKKDFEGLIPAGTPMYQMIPIKRDSWQSKKESFSTEQRKRINSYNSKFWGHYKTKFWQKKDYK